MTKPANDAEAHDEAHRQLLRALTVERFGRYRTTRASDAPKARRAADDLRRSTPGGQPVSTPAPNPGIGHSRRNS
jgi:hypothetical protein